MTKLEHVAAVTAGAAKKPDAPVWLNERDKAIRRAGASGCREFVPILKRIAGSSGKNMLVCAIALNALWELGEPKEYFLRLARDTEMAERVQYIAILILARDPDEGTLDALRAIRQQSNRLVVRNSVGRAESVAELAARFSRVERTEEKTVFLVNVAFRHIGYLDSPDPRRRGGLLPEVAWAIPRLRRLSEEEPELVASHIYDREVGRRLYRFPEGPEQYERNLPRCLAPQALAALKRLRARDRALRAEAAPQDEAGQKQLMADLERVLAGDVPLWRSRIYVHKAGESDHEAYVPILKRIVDAAAEDYRRQKLCFDALHALWLLLEPQEYFLGLVKQHKTKEAAAAYAVSILLREPTDETVRELGKLKEDMDERSKVPEAMGPSVYVRLIMKDYSLAGDVPAKAKILVRELKRNWSPQRVDEYDPERFLNPLSVWCRKKLRSLSEFAPEQVAAYLFHREDLQPAQRKLLAQILHWKARREFAGFEDAAR